MKNIKRTAKGFTLIELIIVIALFSIILTLVMSFIDPVSKIMKKATNKERTAAYVNNIGNYIESSIHYAQYMYVFEGGYVGIDTDGTFKADKNIAASDTDVSRIGEEALVSNMVTRYFPYAVDKNGEALTGKVRILKLVNSVDDSGYSPNIYTGGKKAVVGQIYETVYNFAAPTFDASGNEVEAKITRVSNVDTPLINPEHYKDYTYYFKKGYYTLDPIDDHTKYDGPISFKAEPGTYFSSLVPMTYKDGSNVKQVEISKGKNLAISIVSYQNKNDDPYENKYTAQHKDPDANPPIDESVVLFKSPANIDNVSMAMKNIDDTSYAFTDQVLYTALKTTVDPTGKTVLDLDGSNRQYDPVYRNDGSSKTVFYEEKKATFADANENIYIIYILPSEINDSYFQLGPQGTQEASK